MNQTTLPRGLCGAIVLLAAATVFAGTPGAPPVRLQLMPAAKATGLTYRAELIQAFTFDAHGQAIEISRDYRFRYRFEDALAGEGDRVSASVRFDSVRASFTAHDQRQVLDTRRQIGAVTTIRYARSGGRPEYLTAVPDIEIGGMMGGVMPASLLLDAAFPPLADGPLDVRGTWERTWVRTRLDGGTTDAWETNTRFTLASLEKHDGTTMARVNLTSQQDGLEVTGSLLIGVEDGIVREVTIDEVSTGKVAPGETTYDYRQTSAIRITLVEHR